jgi:predicted HTH domain antitoxin
LTLELAFSLYSQGILSFGKARQLAKLSHYEFGQPLGQRGVSRHYGKDDFLEDLNYARRECTSS